MSRTLINRSADLSRLRDDGYELDIVANHLLLRSVPYVTSGLTVERGILVAELTLAGDVTAAPSTHVVMFIGEMPCDHHGNPLERIYHTEGTQPLGGGLVVHRSFSSKPPAGYPDYYEMMTTYEDLISRHARKIDPVATAQTFAVNWVDNGDSVFGYADTASSRAGIGAMTEKLAIDSVAIVGLGGTGSYILDLVAKTPVKEIHLFDGDRFGQHNAFRSPGAPSVETLKGAPKKSVYFRDAYSPMRGNIFAHGCVDESTVDQLRSMSFVFISVDKGRPRRLVVDRLEEFGVPFIDVGMGLIKNDCSLLGQVRVTVGQPGAIVHSRLPITDNDGDDEYSRNIQTADLNALNAALAVIKWKKLYGFYLDLEEEPGSLYQIDGNCLINENKED